MVLYKGWLVSSAQIPVCFACQAPTTTTMSSKCYLSTRRCPEEQPGTRPAPKEGSSYNQMGSAFKQAAQLEDGSQVKAMLLVWQGQLQNHCAKTVQNLSSVDVGATLHPRGLSWKLEPWLHQCVKGPEGTQDISKGRGVI